MTADVLASQTDKRNKIVLEHLNYVSRIAMVVQRELSHKHTIEHEDLIAWGREGLLRAADRFDAQRGVAFSTFAYYRIKGAMYDGIRRTCSANQMRSRHVAFLSSSNEILQSEAERTAAASSAEGAPAQSEDIAKNVSKIADAMDQIATVYITTAAAQSEPTEWADDGDSPDAKIEHKQLMQKLLNALQTLPENEQKLMQFHYFDDMTIEDASQKLGLSKSWGSRLHTRAIDRLTKRLANQI